MKSVYVHVLISIALTTSTVLGQIPRTLSYQGVLTDNNGPITGTKYVTFKLYDVAQGAIPLWTQLDTLTLQAADKGVFSVTLGKTPFGVSVQFDKQYWLGIQVTGEAELAPRVALTSVGYSMNALRADTAKAVISSSGNGGWTQVDTNVVRLQGKVGIGTASPTEKLQLAGDDPDLGLNIRSGSSSNQTEVRFKMDDTLKSRIFWSKSTGRLYIENMGQTAMIIDGSNVGIGTSAPSHKVHLSSSGGSWGNPRLLIENTGNNDQVALGFRSANYDWEFGAIQDGRLILRDHISGVAKLTVHPGSQGTVAVRVLEITGGADLAEPFEMSHAGAVEPGSVVIIDEDNPGKLKLSSEPYDKRVAGVVSGAGGVNPGLTLKQESLMENGQNVALSGRVYVKATMTNGAIKPGDMLTTSSVPGHAMKATDKELWSGAVIGKAMSVLDEGEGLVLVLVNLQ